MSEFAIMKLLIKLFQPMNQKFMIIVLTISAITVGLLALGFYLGLRYHSSLSASEPMPVQHSEQSPTQPHATEIQTKPYLQSEKPSLEHSTSNANLTLGTPIELSIGESAHDSNITVLFSDVLHDGRCPEDSNCMVAGEAVVELSVRIGTTTKKVYLTTLRGGKSDYWATWKYTEKDYSPEILKVVKAAQAIAISTVYTQGEAYQSSKAIVDGYTFHLNSLTPNRTSSNLAIPKNQFRASVTIERS